MHNFGKLVQFIESFLTHREIGGPVGRIDYSIDRRGHLSLWSFGTLLITVNGGVQCCICRRKKSHMYTVWKFLLQISMFKEVYAKLITALKTGQRVNKMTPGRISDVRIIDHRSSLMHSTLYHNCSRCIEMSALSKVPRQQDTHHDGNLSLVYSKRKWRSKVK
jgi:hypothetical protein